MAGHNKWSKVKRPNGALDARCGKLFSKLAQQMTQSARTSGESSDDALRPRNAFLPAWSTAILHQCDGLRSVDGGEKVFETARNAGADDLITDAEHHVVHTERHSRDTAGGALKNAGPEPDVMKLISIADHFATNDPRIAAQFLHLSGALEDGDDVREVHASAKGLFSTIPA
jgi:transcriptional/translational regulatory protein YebC/TACO1